MKISNAGIQKLSPLNHLEELKFGPSQANNDVAKALAQFTKLKILMVEDTHLTDAGLPPLAALTDLEELSLLRQRQWVGGAGKSDQTWPSRFARHISAWPRPNALEKTHRTARTELSESPVGDAGMEVLEALPNLERMEHSEPAFPMLP